MNLAILTYGLTAVLMLAALPLLLSATRGHWRRRFLGWALVLQSLWAAVIAARTSQVVLSDWLLMAVDALRYGALLCLLVTLSTLPLRAWVAASWLSRLRHYTNLDRCEARLDRLLAEFPMAPMRQVLESLSLLAPQRPQVPHGQPQSLPTALCPTLADPLIA